MSQFNLRYVPTLSTNEFILNGQRFNTQGAVISGVQTTALTTEVIINDQTKNQALYEEIIGNIHGNTFPQLQAEIDALEANVFILQGDVLVLQNEMNAVEGNVLILQGNVVNLQEQISILSGNVVIDEAAIAELIRDTQFLEAPYAGLVGNTSYFVNGLQIWSGDNEQGNGLFVYKNSDSGNVGLNQIRMGVEDNKNILIAGGSQFLQPKSTGNVNIKNPDGNFQFKVGDRTLNNFQFNSQTEINGDIRLKGQDNNKIEIYTQPGSVVPPASAVKRVDIRGDDELRLNSAKTIINEDAGASIVGQGGSFQMTGSSGGYFSTAAKNPRIFAPGGSSPGSISLEIGDCDFNTTGRINIGTEQSLTELGYKEIYIGQSGPPTAARKSSTLIDGDIYLPQNYLPPPAGGGPNLGGWDNILYLGIPTPYSGAFRGPLKNTFSPYVKSISTFSAVPTINSFIQSSGTFSVAVGLGAVTLNAGAGGTLINTAAGLCSLTSLIGGIGMTTAGGAIALTTGAGIIQMTTGAAPIAMETNIGDILLKAGYSNQSTPELSLGSVYIQARDYSYITPDKGVIIGEGIVTPFNEVLLDTMGYTFTGNLYSNIGTPSNLFGVYSNAFVTPASKTTLLNPVTSNLVYFNDLDQTGQAQSVLLNMDINPASIIALSQLATVPAGNVTGNLTNTTTNFYFPDNTLLPLNANVSLFAYPTSDLGNIGRYKYSTWQSNIQIQSNISGFVNSYVEPNPPSYENYMTVLGNVGILADCDVGANITVASSSFPAQQTLITRNSVTTTGNMTCNTLNYTTLNPPIVIPPQTAGVDSIIAGTNISITPLSGQGNVVINCTLPNIAGVSQIIAGNGIQISPVIGTGVVTVELAGSVIPPGGYLPINGGTMTGSIYQSPSTTGTIKKYRPLTSYQPPFPSIGTPSFTGEQLTFFNGDNSPEQVNFTGWFPQNMFGYEPDVITNAIGKAPSNFYSSTGGTVLNAIDFQTAIGNFTVGQRINGGSMVVNNSNPGYRGVLFYIYTAPPGEGDRTQWTLLYQTSLKNFPTTASTYSLSDIDYTYDGSIAQKGQNWMVVYTDDNQGNNIISLNTVNTVIGLISTYAWDGNISNDASGTEQFVGVQADATTSALYRYFPESNTVSKIGGVNLSNGQLGKINGIYYDDVLVTRQIIVYGNFNSFTTSAGPTLCNHIFQYNIDTGAINVLTTQTADPVYNPNKPIGMDGQVWGVEKQLSLTASRRVWIWGDFATVNQMGNTFPPNDVSLNNSSIGYTLSDNWAAAISWGAINAATKLLYCRGGRIAQDDPNNFQTFALMVWAQNYNLGNYRTISIVYIGVGGQTSTLYPFGNGNFGNPAVTTNIVTRIDKIGLRTGPSTVLDQLVFCGSYIGQAEGVGLVDVPCYSLSSTQITGVTWNPAFNPPWSSALKVLARSGDASFWYPNNALIGSTTYYVQTNGTINETAIIGTTGYASTTTNGGGVLTMNNIDFLTTTPTVNKFFIEGVQAYSVNDIIFKDTNKVELTCSLNEDNFWFGQTFDFTLVPPGPPTTPTVNAINGAKFLVNNTEMDKIVFSGGDTDFASVSFIAGSVENGDPYWYWQSQVGALDYFAGNVFYPNITASGTVGGSGVYTAGENITITGNVISVSNPLTANLNLSSFSINGNSIGQLNMSLDSTGLYQIDNFTDSSNLDNQTLLFTNNTNQQLVEVSAVSGFGMEDITGSNVGNFTNTAMVLSNVINNSTFGILKLPFDTNLTSTTGNINISTPDILSITSQNAVEIGTPQRRELLVSFEKQNTGTLSGQNNFDSVSGIQNVSSWTNPTNTIYVDSITASFGYDDGNNGNSTITIALIEDDSGTETVLGSGSRDTSSGLSTQTIEFDPPITINASATKFFFVRLSVPPASPMYSYYGTISDGLTPAIVVTASQLEEVSDPVEYFNVYGNCFFQENVLVHANLTVADPTNDFFKTVVEYNQVQLLGESFNTQMGPGSTYINSGVNQQVQQANLLQIKRTDTLQQSTLSQTQLLLQQGVTKTTTLSTTTCDINSGSGPIARGTLSAGTLALNNNDAGSTITLNKDSVTTAGTIISTISSFARDSGSVSREFVRISSIAQNVATSNQDGTLQFQCLVNGTFNTIMTLNGSSQEIEVGKNIDLNGNEIRTSSGSLVCTSLNSTGTGNATLQSKAGATINIDSGAAGRVNWNTLTATTTPNHNVQFNSTSSGVSSNSYLKMQLNGVDIWVPYLTTDPTL